MSFRWITQFHSGRALTAVIPRAAEPAGSATTSRSASLLAKSSSKDGSPHVHVDAILSIRDHKVNNGVEFSPPAYRVLWLCVLGTHALIATAYTQECIVYVQTIGNPRMNSYLQHFGIGDHLRVDVSMTMIVTSAMVSAWHSVACLRAVLRSLLSRSLIFGLPWKALYSSADSERKETLATKIKNSFYLLYAIGGVRSKYFDVAFDIRELIDIVSQTHQAYSICNNIADTVIQNAAVAILVLSCWTTPVLRFVLRKHEPTKRLLCLIFDIFFDVCFTIGMPYSIFNVWVAVPKVSFSDPVLVVENGAMLAQVLVNSWAALFSSRFPALSALLVLESIKSMIKPRRIHRQVQQQQRTGSKVSKKLSLMSRRLTSAITPAIQPDRIQTMMQVAQRGAKLAHADIVFAVFGCVVLVVYVFAALAAEPEALPPGCKLCMRPWLPSRHPCAVFEINCMERGITGRLQETDLALSAVSPGLLRGLIFAHCPELHVPPRIQELSGLLILAIFNSTVVDWRENAALVSHRHRQLAVLLMVRVDFVEFPQGLLSQQFPSTLVDFKVHQSNLTALPEEHIEAFWPRGMQNFVVEHSRLTRVPRFLSSMQVVGAVSLAGNLIARMPLAEILATSCNRAFLGHNPIEQLTPAGDGSGTIRSTSNSSAHIAQRVNELHLEGTNVSFLPEWIAAAPLSGSGRSQRFVVFGSGSPLCEADNSSTLAEASIVTVNCSSSPDSDGSEYFASLDALTRDLNS